MLRGLLGRLFHPAKGSDPLTDALASPYLERGESESPERHAVRLGETRLLLNVWNRQQQEWLNGVRSYAPAARVPVWDGQPLHGRTVLVHNWPGLGDSLNFVCFVQYLKARGARVIIDVQPPAAALLARVRGVDEVIVDGAGAAGDDTAARDYTLSAPTLLLHALLPGLQEAAQLGAAQAYLAASPQALARWAPRLSDTPRPRVGLSWAGNPTNRNDAIRSLALPQLGALLGVRHASFVSLQVGAASEQARGDGRLLDLSAELRDLEDTAAVISQLDLVISVDSTVAHLAGAMGKPTWLLRSAGADRRWDLVREARHWYPGLRVYGTSQPGAWEKTLARAASDFEGWAATAA
jgi:hypothetical protein